MHVCSAIHSGEGHGVKNQEDRGMLVLSRKQGESIEFPELNVVIRVMQLKKSKVQLGIEAPRTIKVDRSEMVSKQRNGHSACVSPSRKSTRSESITKKSIESAEPESSGGPSEPSKLEDFPQRMMDDLLKLEAEVAAMAELVATKDRELARQVATVSIERSASLRRAIGAAQRNGQARPIAEFMKARGKVLGYEVDSTDRSTEPISDPSNKPNQWEGLAHTNNKSVRQTCSGYVVESIIESPCNVA